MAQIVDGKLALGMNDSDASKQYHDLFEAKF